MRPTNPPRYDAPFHWWGPAWGSPIRRGIADLLRDGTLDSGTGAVLWAALTRRRSVVVVAGPSGVGKTTLLTALLDFLPPDTRRLYLRGSFESFAFLSDGGVVPETSVMLINEISPHLPIYLWGPAVARALVAAERGFSLLATAHAASVAEFVGMFTGSPLRIPAARVGAFEFVVFLAYTHQSPSGRHVIGVSRLVGRGDGVEFDSHFAPNHDISLEASPKIPATLPPWFPERELAERGLALDHLRHGRVSVLPELPGKPETDS